MSSFNDSTTNLEMPGLLPYEAQCYTAISAQQLGELLASDGPDGAPGLRVMMAAAEGWPTRGNS